MTLFFFRQLIYNYPEQLFADAGVMAIEHADFEGVERLALVLGVFHITVLCKSNASEMRKFRSLPLRIFIEKSRKNSRENSVCFER